MYWFKRKYSVFDGGLFILDVSSNEFVKQVKQDCDFIFHFGAPSSVILFNRDPVRTFQETKCGFINVMELAVDVQAEKVVYSSSSSVYGNVPPPQSESMVPKPVNLYGVAKLTTEMIANYYSDRVKCVGLRIFAALDLEKTIRKI